MKHFLPLSLLCSLVVLSACATQEEVGHAHQQHHTHHALQDGEVVPTVDLVVHEDPVAGYNLQVITKNFRFAPENVGREDRPGEGHAHLWIDGKKVMRIYSEWSYLAPLPPGEHEVMVNLNTNSHAALVKGDQEVMATETIVVPSDGLAASLTGLLGSAAEDTCEKAR